MSGGRSVFESEPMHLGVPAPPSVRCGPLTWAFAPHAHYLGKRRQIPVQRLMHAH